MPVRPPPTRFSPCLYTATNVSVKKSFCLWQSSFTTLCTTYALGSSLRELIWRTTARHYCDKTSFKPEKVGELLEREREIHLREKIEREKEIRWWTNKKQTVNMNDFNCCSRIYTDFTVCFNITCPIKISPPKKRLRGRTTFRYQKLSIAALKCPVVLLTNIFIYNQTDLLSLSYFSFLNSVCWLFCSRNYC